PHRRGGTPVDEAHGVPDQHHPRAGRRRGRTGGGAARRRDRRRRSGRLRERTGGPPGAARAGQRGARSPSGFGDRGDAHRDSHVGGPQCDRRPVRRARDHGGDPVSEHTPRRVVIAPDKFKGSLTAVEAAEAIGAGVRDALPDADVSLCPVADGGEGTLDVLLAAGGTRVDLRVRGPLDEPVDAWYVTLDGTAYIESARACGIEHVTPSSDVALAAHTYGVGELIADALGRGATQIVLTVGGTASTDGGSGMLQALGARITDADGAPVGLGGGALADVAAVDLTRPRALLGDARVRVATDVT